MKCPLDMDVDQIKTIESSALYDILPLYEKKLEEVKKELEHLQNIIKKYNQKLNFLEHHKIEIEESITRYQIIDMQLSIRKQKVDQELTRAKVICPIFQYKTKHFIEQYGQTDCYCKNTVQKKKHIENRNQLLEQKNNLQKAIDEHKKSIDSFVTKYLL